MKKILYYLSMLLIDLSFSGKYHSIYILMNAFLLLIFTAWNNNKMKEMLWLVEWKIGPLNTLFSVTGPWLMCSCTFPINVHTRTHLIDHWSWLPHPPTPISVWKVMGKTLALCLLCSSTQLPHTAERWLKYNMSRYVKWYAIAIAIFFNTVNKTAAK